MIHSIGRKPATRHQIKILKHYADNSFMRTCDETELGEFPNPPQNFEAQELTLISLKNVQPHTDDWGGYGKDEDSAIGPKNRLAMFWVVSSVKREYVYFQCGDQALTMRPGDFVIFDDRVMHSVQSDVKWWGIAVQLRGPA